MKFYIVPANVALQYEGLTNDSEALHFRKDISGRYVVNTSVAEIWPGIDWEAMPVEDLTTDDFPPAVLPVTPSDL